MATATITLKDDGEGQVDVVLDFGEGGTDDNSEAHHMAFMMVRTQLGGLTDKEEEGCGHG